MMRNTTGNRKYDAVSRDFRIMTIRPATFAESNGESGWVMVELAEGCTVNGAITFIAYSVTDVRDILDTTHCNP